ncbi:phenylalanine--tRNA ligase subunit beta [Entomobacter blattae]|uniref:Phenylalanine--tRNA ligase beta subunit n=1 Tax=Entomobacter blattae TaxID=2762277 RepID=A0A7H1NRG9_9PROT|nr:phenylalanine--tRNA ligase subunit beta [Entomobacter blattae]QNT78379.1 Phenylalanine--tRNA ligase beta subunit [Entomobacter blattae]
MKFTLSWLCEHLETSATIEEICACLNMIGLEVESCENRADTLAPFITARIVRAIRHPNADRLQVCMVDIGQKELVQVVCGAPNARAGLNVIFAPPGSYIPGSEITIKEGAIRGEKSAGMLCSLRELGLGNEHEGIAELGEDAVPGQLYAIYADLDDPVIDIAITPNRGDALGVRGVARDLAAAGLGTLKPWLVEAVEGQFPSPMDWVIEDSQSCPWVLGRVVRGVKNGPSPEWLQARLRAVGVRPVSALVDITQFFTLDLNRPLHVFDLNRLKGNQLTICRGEGESFLALDGKEYTLTPEDCVIVDASGVQSLAGIMGGEGSAVTEETTDIFLECALFDPVRIAHTGRRLNIVSDARYRFERGLDQANLPAMLQAATHMVIELCGGEASEVTSAGQEPSWKRNAEIRFERLHSFGGMDVSPQKAGSILHHLGFEQVVYDEANGQAVFSVPAWRNDIAAPFVLDQRPGQDAVKNQKAAEGAREIEAENDLIEEVLRIIGLDHIPSLSLPGASALGGAAVSPLQVRIAAARRLLSSQGLMETIGFSFVSHELAGLFGEIPESLHLLNPIATDMDQLRPTPLVNLFSAVMRNHARGCHTVGLFEVGVAFHEQGQRSVVAGLCAGYSLRHPGGGNKPAELWKAKVYAQSVLEALGLSPDSLTVTLDTPPYYHPGQSGTFRQGPKNILGYFGALHPKLLHEKGIDYPIVGFEIFLDEVPTPRRGRKAISMRLPVLQSVRRDFAFVVSKEVEAQTLLRVVRSAERGLITEVSLFDVYEGDKIPADSKSLAVEVVLQPLEKSLTDAEIEQISEKIVAAVNKAVGGQLRQ